jgi:GNAT superfamily N-acetyltransferase
MLRRTILRGLGGQIVSDPTKIVMRRARREDAPAIVAMLADDILGRDRERPQDPLPDSYYAAFAAIDADPRNLLAVACDAAGDVVGCLQLTFVPSLGHQGAERALVESVSVRSTLRGQGIGHSMLEWAIGQARARGCGSVRLTTHKVRTDAQRFYLSLGFTASHEGMTLTL